MQPASLVDTPTLSLVLLTRLRYRYSCRHAYSRTLSLFLLTRLGSDAVVSLVDTPTRGRDRPSLCRPSLPLRHLTRPSLPFTLVCVCNVLVE